MLTLPHVCLVRIFQFSYSKHIISSFQLVDKNWKEAADDAYLWRHVSLQTLNNKKIISFLKTHGKHFIDLTIQSTRLSRNATYKILFHCKRLKNLCLNQSYSNSLVDNRFCFLISKLGTLQQLNLPDDTTISDVGLAHLCRLKKLRTLNLRCNNHIQDFSKLKHLPLLENIDVSRCFHVDNAFCAAASSLSLKSFNVSYCYQVTTDGLMLTIQNGQKKLQKLELNGLRVTAELVEALGTKTPALRVLTLNSLSIDEHVYKRLHYIKSLKELSIIGCSKIFDFRYLKLSLQHFVICRTSFDVFGRKGLIEYANDHIETTFHLYDNFSLKSKEQTAVYLLPNVLLKYS